MTSTPPPAPGSPGLSADRPAPLHQPYLHDLVGVFHAPFQAWSQPCGQMTGGGAEGIYLGDTRVVSALRCVAVAGDGGAADGTAADAAPGPVAQPDDAQPGVALTPLTTEVRSAREIRFRDVVTVPGGPGEALLVLHRIRTAGPDGIREQLRLVSDDHLPHRVRLRLGLVTDAASMSQVKDPHRLDRAGDLRPAATVEGRAADGSGGGAASWPIGADGGAARLGLGAGASALAADGPIVTWSIDLEVAPHGTAESSWTLRLTDPSVPFVAPETMCAPRTRSADGSGASGATSSADPSGAAPSAASPSGTAPSADPSATSPEVRAAAHQIGRASCRERV